MTIRFEKAYLEELYNTGKCTDKKYRFQRKVIDSYARKIDILGSASNTEALFRINSLNYEVLKGDKKRNFIDPYRPKIPTGIHGYNRGKSGRYHLLDHRHYESL